MPPHLQDHQRTSRMYMLALQNNDGSVYRYLFFGILEQRRHKKDNVKQNACTYIFTQAVNEPRKHWRLVRELFLRLWQGCARLTFRAKKELKIVIKYESSKLLGEN